MAEKAEKGESKQEAIRITNQFRSKSGFVYDLRSSESPLTISISARENDDEKDAWRVDAQFERGTEAVIITEWGPSKADALTGVSRSWTEKASELGLPTFDWEAVARVLAEVRAV